MERISRFFTIFLSLGLLFGCQPANSEVPKAQVKALLEQTRANMVFVEGGSFMMGDAGSDEFVNENGEKYFGYWTSWADNKPAHKVTLDSYYIQKYEVTWEEMDIFYEVTGREKYRIDRAGEPTRLPNQPAGVPDWYTAKAYCEWLGKESGLPYDLSTEAQWEYAARSRGQNIMFPTDNGKIESGRNYRSQREKYPLPGGHYPPNPLGLYHMAGNAGEWVNDWYDPDYYKKSPENNPKGPETGEKKIFRGGFSGESPNGSNAYNRGEMVPHAKGGFLLGFRCALNTENAAE